MPLGTTQRSLHVLSNAWMSTPARSARSGHDPDNAEGGDRKSAAAEAVDSSGSDSEGFLLTQDVATTPGDGDKSAQKLLDAIDRSRRRLMDLAGEHAAPVHPWLSRPLGAGSGHGSDDDRGGDRKSAATDAFDSSDSDSEGFLLTQDVATTPGDGEKSAQKLLDAIKGRTQRMVDAAKQRHSAARDRWESRWARWGVRGSDSGSDDESRRTRRAHRKRRRKAGHDVDPLFARLAELLVSDPHALHTLVMEAKPALLKQLTLLHTCDGRGRTFPALLAKLGARSPPATVRSFVPLFAAAVAHSEWAHVYDVQEALHALTCIRLPELDLDARSELLQGLQLSGSRYVADSRLGGCSHCLTVLSCVGSMQAQCSSQYCHSQRLAWYNWGGIDGVEGG